MHKYTAFKKYTQLGKKLENNRLGDVSLDMKSKKWGVVTYIKKDLKPKLIPKSEDGRFLFTEITINDQKVLIVNIYTPNTHQGKFYKNLNSENLIMKIGLL